MVNLSIVLLYVGIGIGILSVALTLLLVNLIYNVAVENQKLASIMQLMIKENNVNTLAVSQMTLTLHRLERATEVIMTAIESLVDDAQNSHMNKPGSLRDGRFFSTEDGRIKASNINDFITKLQNDPAYIDIAEELRVQLEKELAEEDINDDSDGDLPYES